MSFELSPNDRIKCYRGSNVNRWSVLVTLIAPLFAVLLSNYLNARQKCQTTFAVPAPSIGVSLPEDAHPEPRRVPPPTADSPKNPVRVWQACALQPKKQALAKRLIATAGGVKNDPASQFIMLRRAKDVAVEANDGQTAFQVIDSMAETFHVDAGMMKMAVLAKLAAAARKPAQHQAIAEQALQLADEAAGQERLMVASQLGRLALAEAKRALDDDLLAKAQGRITGVAEQARARECSSGLSGGWRQQTDAGRVQELQPEAKQDDGANRGDNFLAAKSKCL